MPRRSTPTAAEIRNVLDVEHWDATVARPLHDVLVDLAHILRVTLLRSEQLFWEYAPALADHYTVLTVVHHRVTHVVNLANDNAAIQPPIPLAPPMNPTEEVPMVTIAGDQYRPSDFYNLRISADGEFLPWTVPADGEHSSASDAYLYLVNRPTLAAAVTDRAQHRHASPSPLIPIPVPEVTSPSTEYRHIRRNRPTPR